MKSIAITTYALSLATFLSACQPQQGFQQVRSLTAKEQNAITQVVTPAIDRISNLSEMGAIAGDPTTVVEATKYSTTTSKVLTSSDSEESALVCEQQVCASTKTMKEVLDADNANAENVDLTRSLIALINSEYKNESQMFVASTQPLFKTEFKTKPKVSTEAQDLIYLNYLMALFKKASVYAKYDAFAGAAVFDYDRYRADTNADDLQIGKIDAEGINLILRTRAVSDILAGISFNDLLKETAIVHPEIGSIKKAAFSKATDFEKIFNKMYAILKVKPAISGAIKKSLQMQELNESDMKTLMQDYLNSELAELALNGELKGAANRSLFFSGPAFKKLTTITAEQASKSFVERLDQRQKYCTLNIAKSLVLAPTNDQLSVLKKNALLAQGLAESELSATLKDQKAKASVVEKVRQTTFSFPETKKSISNALSVFLNEKIQSQSADVSIESQWIKFIQISTDLAFHPKSESAPFEATAECGLFVQNSVSDSTRTSIGSIALSPTTAQDAKIGLGIISHELGHVVSAALRERNGFAIKADLPFLDKKSEQDFTCVLNRLNNNENLLEESFADNFSARLIKRLHQSDYAKNFGCFIEQLGTTSAPSVVNSDPTDPHPASFFRALTLQQDLFGTLPAVCFRYLESQGFKQFAMCPAP